MRQVARRTPAAIRGPRRVAAAGVEFSRVLVRYPVQDAHLRGRSPDYESLRVRAEAEGRECVVGALILNDDGRVFVHRRGWTRRLLPGCWDIVGGHLDQGEGLLECLRREVEEETGWIVAAEPQLAHIADWHGVEDGHLCRRREFDFLVAVDGDLEQPRLEHPKQVEFRWLGRDDLGVLDENRGEDEGQVRRLIELTLRSAARSERAYPHVMAFPDPDVIAPLEALRFEWDPAMAAQIPAHVTVTYPAEIDSVDVLLHRVEIAASQIAPFRFRLSNVCRFSPPDEGVFVAAEDVNGGWAQLRRFVLDDACTIADVRPHLTIVHPRTTNRSKPAWEKLRDTTFALETLIDRVVVTAFDGRSWCVLARFPLKGRLTSSASPRSS